MTCSALRRRGISASFPMLNEDQIELLAKKLMRRILNLALPHPASPISVSCDRQHWRRNSYSSGVRHNSGIHSVQMRRCTMQNPVAATSTACLKKLWLNALQGAFSCAGRRHFPQFHRQNQIAFLSNFLFC